LKIVESNEYKIRLREITNYIKQDKKSASINFAKELRKKIRKLPDNPYMCPPSYYFKENNVRDMTFKKYTIIYEIKPQKDIIEILDIFNRNKPYGTIWVGV
jgi:plasmid stabilization system protein ParE